jgi:hypothetical protein
MRTRSVVALTLVLVALVACSGGDDDAAGRADAPDASPTGSLFTLTPAPVPSEPPPTGKLRADLRQSSRDAALNRFEVWIDNDTDAAITPTRVTYRDGRFETPLDGTRLREIPSQSERGFPVYEPDRPACGSDATSGTVTVAYGAGDTATTVTVPVEDEADVVDRLTSARCLELAIDDVAHLRWDDAVPASGDGGQGSVGTLTLLIEPTGRPGGSLAIDSIVGNPVLAPDGADVWRPALTITGDQQPQRLELPLKPNRCDAHAFSESGAAGAFALNVHLDGKAGQYVLRMSPEGVANAVAFGKASCGELTGT